jgi:dolichol-phosphate mannosyltransferase
MTVGPVSALVIIPTYNELQNLPVIVDRVHRSNPDVDILIVDDGSPDGTGVAADTLASGDTRIHVLHRPGKGGLGAAYIAGFRWGLDHGYGMLIEMDADGSHPPETLSLMIGTLSADPAVGLVIGSRWVNGGSVVDWPRRREVLSRAANLYSRTLLAIDVRDSTAGYRVYRSEVLETMAFEEISSRGYCFQIDMTLRTLDGGFMVREVPIEFRERQIGVSKMSTSIIVEAMTNVTVWGLKRLVGRPR